MTNSIRVKKPPYIWSAFTNRCPRCREGKLFVTDNAYDFKRMTDMNVNCPVCGQPTEIEVGFYYGTGFVSYALTVAFSVASFVAWLVLVGFSLYDNRIFYWLGVNAVLLVALQPIFMRLSRSLWLSWFVKFNPNWKQEKAAEYERVIKEQMSNW